MYLSKLKKKNCKLYWQNFKIYFFILQNVFVVVVVVVVCPHVTKDSFCHIFTQFAYFRFCILQNWKSLKYDIKLLYIISLNLSWQTLNFVIKFVFQPKFGKLGIFKSKQTFWGRAESLWKEVQPIVLLNSDKSSSHTAAKFSLFHCFHSVPWRYHNSQYGSLLQYDDCDLVFLILSPSFICSGHVPHQVTSNCMYMSEV